MRSKDLYETAEACHQILATLLDQVRPIVDARFTDQIDEMGCVYLANLKAGVNNVGEAMIDLARRTETAARMLEMREHFADSMEEMRKQQEDLARGLQG